jgi:two-component system, OmpR family, response regulator
MPSSTQPTVLCVDDDKVILTLFERLLTNNGYAVVTAESGDQALEVIQQTRPDLILLDVMMPGMDGPATLAALRELPATAATPIIFMTAKIQPHEMDHYRALGSAGVIAKPFDPTTLPQKVRDLWREHHT